MKWALLVVTAVSLCFGALGAVMMWMAVGQPPLGRAPLPGLVQAAGSLIVSETFWTAVGSLVALGGLAFAGRQLFLTRKIEAYKLVCEDDESFESDEMRAARSNLARVLLQDPANFELINERVHEVLGFFEELGLMLRKGIAPIEFVWSSHSGNYYALRYWQVLKAFVSEDRQRENDPNYYTDFEYLYSRVVAYETKKLRRPPALTQRELHDFLEEELDAEIRIVLKDDLEKLEEIESRSFTSDALDYEDSEKAYEERRTWFFVASILNEVVGYVLGSVSADGRQGEVESLAVEPEYRRCGIGSRLLSHLLDRLKRERVECISLQVETSSVAAIKLYERAGFRRVETLNGYYSDGSDAYSMRAELAGLSPAEEGQAVRESGVRRLDNGAAVKRVRWPPELRQEVKTQVTVR